MKNQAHRSVAWALVMLAALWVGNNVQGQNLAVEQEAKRQSHVVRSQKDTRLSAAERKLLGKHKFSLQWISWERFGVATVKRGRNGLEIDAKQALNGDWVSMKGTVSVVDSKTFYVTGKIITRVHHINEGMPCERSGTFEFHAKGQRQYWRMQQIDNPCDRVADYIDVYFN